MSKQHRPLLMRANRLLGAALVEANLVQMEQLEQANERLLEIIAGDQPRQSTLLGVLAYEMKAVREEDVIQHLVEHEGVAAVDLRCYDVAEEFRKGLELGACWATWSVPFDREEGFVCMATAHYLSPAVRSHWEKQFDGPILWFATTLEGLADHLEKLEAADAPATT